MSVRIHTSSRTYDRIETAAMPVIGGDEAERLRRAVRFWRNISIALAIALALALA